MAMHIKGTTSAGIPDIRLAVAVATAKMTATFDASMPSYSYMVGGALHRIKVLGLGLENNAAVLVCSLNLTPYALSCAMHFLPCYITIT